MATSYPSSDPQLFHCPTCGAALPAPGNVASVRCDYCGSTVLVPKEYRTREPETPQVSFGQPVVINLRDAVDTGEVAQTGGKLLGILGFLIVACVVVSMIGGVLAASGAFSATKMVNQTINSVMTVAVETIPAQLSVLTTPTANPFYQTVLQFGAKGTGPGQFDDSRVLAIDPDGNIFTAEYDDGRVQKFDPSGKFLALINVPPDDQGYAYISDIAADYAGRIYVVRRGDILIYNAADGARVGEIPGSFPNTRFETLVVDPANNLYAFHVMAGVLDLIKMDTSGTQSLRKTQVTEGLVKKTEISSVDKMAVDGLGNLYMLDTSQNQVYKFDQEASFLDRFGSKGEGPGMLRGPEDLVVDGQGRIYVLDWDGIEIFDNNGMFLKQVPGDWVGHAFDIQLDLQGNVYIITNQPQVLKFTLDFSQ